MQTGLATALYANVNNERKKIMTGIWPMSIQMSQSCRTGHFEDGAAISFAFAKREAHLLEHIKCLR